MLVLLIAPVRLMLVSVETFESLFLNILPFNAGFDDFTEIMAFIFHAKLKKIAHSPEGLWATNTKGVSCYLKSKSNSNCCQVFVEMKAILKIFYSEIHIWLQVCS